MFKRTANDLGLDQVLNQIAKYSLSFEGSEAVKSAIPVFNSDSYSTRQNQVSDTVSSLIRAQEESVSLQSFPSLKGVFDYILSNPTGSLDGENVYNTALYIESACILRHVFTLIPNTSVSSVIDTIDDDLMYFKNEAFKILESPGVVKESYPTVKNLIEKAEGLRVQRTKFASDYMKSNNSIMQSDSAVMRDGRILLPVKVESRSRIDGYVQGASQSGGTVFVEPFKLVDINNSVSMAQTEIEMEKARLIGMLSNLIRGFEEKLRVLSSQIQFADFLFSFATWVLRDNCTRVLLDENFTCNLIKARHPLLKEKCVPIDFAVQKNIKSVVLTGPNAGGKTVTIKTVGLFALLNQICGFVPASDGTSLSLFDRVFTDIGDDQSIENNLSTFSGHMSSVSFILRSMTPSSLVILDELGSGTDPQEGASLARAILEYCNQKASLTLVTSHHGVLKQYAYASEQVMNASMEFNEKTLEPTFKVINGLPGESHAIDTAKRMCLPRVVIQSAQKYMGSEAVKISSIIKNLEAKERQTRETEEELRRMKNIALEKQGRLDKKERELARLENTLKKEGLRDFDDLLKETRSELENLVRELREGELTQEKKQKVKDHILKIESQKQKTKEEIKKKEEELDKQDLEELLVSEENVKLEVGMDVLCGQYKREGTIVKVEGNGKYQVAIGNLKFTFKETDLRVPKRSAEKKVVYSFDNSSATPRPKLDMDLRGYRLLEALDELQNQIEACCIYNINSFSIIHGYGDGILSTGIHKFLKDNKIVEEYHFALPEDGGQGKTYVKLK